MAWTTAKTDPSITIENNGQSLKKISGSGQYAKAIGSVAAPAGTSAFEIVVSSMGNVGVGLSGPAEPMTGVLGNDAATAAVIWNDGWYFDGEWRQCSGFTVGKTVRVSYDTTTKTARWFIDGVLALARVLNIGNQIFPAVSLRNQGDALTTDFSPTGATAWEPDVATPPPPPPPPPPTSATSTFFADRAAALAATAIPADARQIQTGCFSLSGNKRRGGGTYSRLSAPPSAGLQATTAVIHVTNDANAQPGGSWWILQASKGGVEFDQLGCVPSVFGDYVTGVSQNAAAFLAYEELVLETFYSDVKTLYVNPGWYAFPDTLILKRTPVAVVGQSTVTEWSKTVFAFPFHKDGIILHYGNTKGNTTLTQEYDPPGSVTNNGGGAAGSRFEGIAVFGNNGDNYDATAICDGFVFRARAYLRNVFTANFSRHGFYVVTSIGAGMDNPTGAGNGYPAGNANNTRFHECTAHWCGGTGFRIAGADSNACSVMDCESNYNGLWGLEDVSFLGPNGIFNFHTTDNGIGVGSTGTHGYVGRGGASKSGALVTHDRGTGVKTYVAVLAGDFTDLLAQWGRYCDTVPGTNEAVWQYYHDGDSGWSKPWLPNQPRGTYTTGGSLGVSGVNLKTAAIATYHESAQPPVQFRCAGGTYMGSQTASNMTKGSYGFINDNYELRSSHPQVSRYLKDNVWQEIRQQAVYGDDRGTPGTNYRKSSAFSMGLYEAYEGDNAILRYEAPNSPAHARLEAIAGFNSTGLGVDGSGQKPDPGLRIFTGFSLATPYAWGWQLRRQAVLRNHEIAPVALGSYDIVWYPEARNGTTSDDFRAMEKGGWAGRVILAGGAAGVEKSWANFGQIEDIRGLGPAPLSTLFPGAPNTLAAGASTGWLMWGGNGGIGPTDELSLTFSRGSDVSGAPTLTKEASYFGNNDVGVRITNTGGASLNLGSEVRLTLRVRK